MKVDSLKWVMAKLHPGRYGDRPQVEYESGKHITITWAKTPSASPPAGKPEPLRAIQYKPEQPPAGLDPERWVRLTKLIASIRKIAPSDVGFDGGA